MTIYDTLLATRKALHTPEAVDVIRQAEVMYGRNAKWCSLVGKLKTALDMGLVNMPPWLLDDIKKDLSE